MKAKQKKIIIKNLNDLKLALENKVLKKGSPILLDGDSSFVFLGYQRKALYGKDVIVTIEPSPEGGTERGIYFIDEKGLNYYVHSEGDSIKDGKALRKAFPGGTIQ